MNKNSIGGMHPIPSKYHKAFYIGETDRRGNVIDFKVPPVILDSAKSMTACKSEIFGEYVSAENLSRMYNSTWPFIILRPTGLLHISFVREQLRSAGIKVVEEVELDNFMKLADSLYFLDPKIPFHWKWRVIMRTMHASGLMNQNRAVVFFLESKNPGKSFHSKIMEVKKRIRVQLGELPVIVKYNRRIKIALGIHHLHSPDESRLPIEFNALMHACNKTSIFEP
jgi:hypothetical protein